MTNLIVGLLIGILLGVACLYIVRRSSQAVETQMKDSFANLSQQALQTNAEQVVRLAKEVLSGQTEAAKSELEKETGLIDKSLGTMNERLVELQGFVQKADKDREGSHRALSAQLQAAAQETAKLRQTADQLGTALASPQHRGQWGERMAEDVLRLAGFIKGVNYLKQHQLVGATRPDFTFPLPNGLKLNMDVKFPLANYLRYLDAKSEDEHRRYGKAFVDDVKNRVKEASSRDYINPADNTVDYALVFIPNEQVYASIYELNPAIIDEALRQKIVLCSPLTLYAVLAVIRQAAENVRMERRAFEMAGLINDFVKQWGSFKEELERLGKQLETARGTHERMATTRLRQLEKPLDKIEELRSESGELALPDAKPAGERTSEPQQ